MGDSTSSPQPNPEPSPPVFFEFRQELDVFGESILEKLQQVQEQVFQTHLSQQNTQRYSHGRSWTHRANPEIGTGHMQTASSSWEVGFQEIVDGNLSAIRRCFSQVAEDMQRQMMQMLYSTISEACNKSGNVVTGGGSFPIRFLEALGKIEFGVDREGNVCIPEVHVGADGHKLIAELEAQPPEFHQEVERLKDEKNAAALQREEQRKARFKRATV